MSTVLVTGGAGFIGARLCRRLLARGDRVISLDDYSTGCRDNHIDYVEYRVGSTLDIEQFAAEDFDRIFHLGEFARVHASYEEWERVLVSNHLGTARVFNFWRDRPWCKLIYAGSSTRFAADGDHSPYSLTKANNTRLLAGEDGNWAIGYFYNVYGPGERAGVSGTLIETFRQQYLAGQPLTVVAPGTQRRNFTHVDDIVDGLLLIADKGRGEYAIGSSQDYSLLDVADMFGGPIATLPARRGDRTQSWIDNRPIHALGWQQRRTLGDYIAEIKAAIAA